VKHIVLIPLKKALQKKINTLKKIKKKQKQKKNRKNKNKGFMKSDITSSSYLLPTSDGEPRKSILKTVCGGCGVWWWYFSK
jgi:hypothetical protein